MNKIFRNKLATKQKTHMIFILALLASSMSFAQTIDGGGGSSSQPGSGGSGGAPIDGSHGSSGSSGGVYPMGCDEIQIECNSGTMDNFPNLIEDVQFNACSGGILIHTVADLPDSGTLLNDYRINQHLVLSMRSLSRAGGDIFKLPKSLSDLSFSVSKIISTSQVYSLNNEDFEIISIQIKVKDDGKKLKGTFYVLAKNRYNKLFYTTNYPVKCQARFQFGVVRER